MGLFSSKKTIKVASTVYHLSGPEEDRPNFLKSSLFSAVMSPQDQFLGEAVVRNYLTGPGITQRQFHAWGARTNYAGMSDFSVKRAKEVDPDVVKPFIPVPSDPPGLVTELQVATLGAGDYSVFAEQWLMENNPTALNTEYVAEYFDDDHTITIQYEGGSTVTFGAGIYDKDKQFISAPHYFQIPTSVQDEVEGTLVQDESTKPDTTDFTQDSLTNTGIVTHSLAYDKTVTKTYSDSTPQDGPTTTSETEDVDFNGTLEEWSKTEYVGGDGGSETSNLLTTLNIWENRKIVDRVSTTVVTNDLGGGVTETVTTTIDGDHLDPVFEYRTDTQETINGEVVGGDQMWIYEIGSGNATLDALSEDVANDFDAEFYPFIPVRLDNKSITHADFGDTGSGLYEDSVAAYRKATKGAHSFTDLIEQVEDNEDLDEIDYAYVVYGATLNTGELACREFIYEFLKGLIPFQDISTSYMDDFKFTVANYEQLKTDYQAWVDAQVDENDPLYGTPSPGVPSLVAPEATTMKLRTSNVQTDDYDVRISWVSIVEEIHAGKGKVDAKEGDIWFENAGKFEWTQGSSSSENAIEETHMFWQTGSNTYKKLVIHGLIHQNFIYKGKSVDITAHEALADEDTSGFIVPMHDPTVRAMGMVASTQMAMANTFIVFNTYKVFQKKWYETFFGMLLIVVVVVVVSVLVSPLAVGGISGALGTNAAVGAALGLSGVSAIVAGAVANALAAIVISSVISSISIEVFGEKYGGIIAGVISFVVNFGIANGFSNFTVSQLMNPQNMLVMSSALANGYNGMVQADIAQMNADLEAMAEENADQLEELNQMIRDLGGSNDLSFDPMQLTDVNAGNGQGTGGSYVPESLDEFIHRTTLTGSDIVEVTLSMVDNYADLNLQLPQT